MASCNDAEKFAGYVGQSSRCVQSNCTSRQPLKSAPLNDTFEKIVKSTYSAEAIAATSDKCLAAPLCRITYFGMSVNTFPDDWARFWSPIPRGRLRRKVHNRLKLPVRER